MRPGHFLLIRFIRRRVKLWLGLYSSPLVDFVPMNNTRAFIIVNAAIAIVQAPVVQRGDNLYLLKFIFFLGGGGGVATFHWIKTAKL